MLLPKYKEEREALQSLKERGFNEVFQLSEPGVLLSKSTDETFSPDELRLREFHRFHIPTPTHQETTRIVYALESEGGTKGLVVHHYDINDPLLIARFMNRVKIGEF